MSIGQVGEIGLRAWSPDDLWLLERLMGDASMTRHLGGPERPEKIRDRHERYCRSADSVSTRMFVIVAGPEGSAVGSTGYWEREWKGSIVWETGWSVLPDAQGRGVATRAVAAVIVHARAAAKHRYLHAFPSIANEPSNAICRKLGFGLQSQVDFEYPPGHVMVCNDWRLDLQR